MHYATTIDRKGDHGGFSSWWQFFIPCKYPGHNLRLCWFAGGGSVGGGYTLEYKSRDLGDTWSAPRCLTVSTLGVHGAPVPKLCKDPKTSTMIGGTPTGDGGHSIWTSAGAALQLSPCAPQHVCLATKVCTITDVDVLCDYRSNKFAPNRLIFTGHVNGCQQFWHTDDGDNYTFAKDATGQPLCIVGIGEVGFAETPEGGLLGSGRNGIFHGPGKCDWYQLQF